MGASGVLLAVVDCHERGVSEEWLTRPKDFRFRHRITLSS